MDKKISKNKNKSTKRTMTKKNYEKTMKKRDQEMQTFWEDFQGWVNNYSTSGNLEVSAVDPMRSFLRTEKTSLGLS